MIDVVNVTKTYGPGREKVALPPISASFDSGELVWLSGRSGSGKSTLLGIASLLVVETAGTVRYAGREVSRKDDQLRARLRREHFGIIPQSPRLFAELSSMQNVMLSASSVTADRARESLDLVGLGAATDRSVKTMSGGEQQRVSIARAIAKRPQVIFADELTSALDDVNAHAVWKVLRSIVDDGCCVVVASHDARIAEYANRLISLEIG